MKESVLDIVMHPIRMRIIQAMIMGGTMTPQQIGEMMPEVPQATMYRHLNALLRAGVLTVQEERPVRGTVEKVYCLSGALNSRTNEELKNADGEEKFRYFFTFLMNLLGDFERYLSQEKINMPEDGLSFSQASVYATDEEFAAFAGVFADAFQNLLQNKPVPGRKLRTIATIVIPQAQKSK